jgi:hypothetical protein
MDAQTHATPSAGATHGRDRARPLHCGILCALCIFAAAPALAQPKLKTYQTKYYVLHTDLDADGVREATLRITLMAEEYQTRTKGLAGTVGERLPFYLFSRRQDYEAFGGVPGSAGLFSGDRLMAVTSPTNPAGTWHAVQHEGFHQFVSVAIGGGIPMWANEGLAEYFGEGLFTGDQFITGFIPQGRLERMRQTFKRGKFKTLRDMMLLRPEVWNADLSHENYDQAWSMVQFLAHGEKGKYQSAFIGFLRDVSHHTNWEEAWVKNFGGDVQAFQERWEEYWAGLPENPTLDLYAEASVSALTSFYARAFAQRQQFESVDDFFAAAEAKRLKCSKQDWLPASLLTDALRRAPLVGEWSQVRKAGHRLLVCETPTGTVLEGSFVLDGSRVDSVSVKVTTKRK